MNKATIIKGKQSLTDWCLSLNHISDAVWFQSFREGSWGTADVISHLISWEYFMINKRLPYVLNGEECPKVPVDVEVVNKQASLYARSGISKEDLINEFISARRELVSILEQITEEQFEKPCPWNSEITLGEYLEKILEHDLKHKEEIDIFIKSVS